MKLSNLDAKQVPIVEQLHQRRLGLLETLTTSEQRLNIALIVDRETPV